MTEYGNRESPVNPPTQRTGPTQHEAVLLSHVPDASMDAESAAAEHPVSATLTLLPLQVEPEPRILWDTRLLADASAGRNARLHVRTRLTMANWTGSIETAARIA